MFYPHNVFKIYGKTLDDLNIDEMYDELVANPQIRKREASARDILNQIAKMQLQSGYPYLVFKDNANKVHPLKNIGEIKQSNLCSEILQLQETSTITNYGQEDDIKRDIVCNLGSINIVNIMESDDFYAPIKSAMRALTTVTDLSEIENAPGVKKANEELHSVGLGVMNLHGFFAKNHIEYESEEAKEFASVFFAMMNYYSLLASCNIARTRKVTFKDFEKSEYANGNYFDQ